MILDGKIVAAAIKQRLKEEINERIDVIGRRPKLVIISVGNDSASKVYVRNKIKAAGEVGIIVKHFPLAVLQDNLPSTKDVQDLIVKLNRDEEIDGIMVQLPLPKHLNERAIIDAIDPEKDVDGLTTTNIGRLRSGQPSMQPCTAKGIIDLCRYYSIELDGKDVTIVGRSNIVGKPIADMMMAEGATVTQCHSHTTCLQYHCHGADIVVSAVGKPNFIDARHILKGTEAVIDVGINRDEEGKLCGDVYFENVKPFVEHITPVPGGVGPMTVAELMSNTVASWRKRAKNYGA